MKRLAFFAVAVVFLIHPPRAGAHETDQFTVPPGREFADIGPFLSRWMYNKIERGVEKANQRIRRAVEKGSQSDLADAQSPEAIASAVNSEFPWAMDMIEGFDQLVHSRQMQDRYPGKVVGYKHSLRNILSNTHFILDPRQLFRIWLASTVKAYGTYLGTDKLGHFTDMGMNYYREYRRAIRAGHTEDEAVAKAVYMGTHGLIFSERGMLGFMTAGAYSNGDLAADYLGMQFYRNLTEPVMLKGRMQPPMLVRDGPYWKLAPHVTRDSDFFAVFISDHLDEALNPSLFEAGMRNAVRNSVRRRAEIVRWQYLDVQGRPRSREWFEKKLEEHRTYYGVDYGHMGEPDQLVSIANTCFDSSIEERLASVTTRPVYLTNIAATDAQGRTALHWEAREGDAPSIIRLIDSGLNVDAADNQGQTPLHFAALADSDVAVVELLGRRANIAAADKFGATPLHIAAAQRGGQAAKTLISSGASVRARDDFGRTPLHDAAASGSPQTVLLLLDAGASIDQPDAYGTTPLHLACRNNREAIASILIDRGADIDAVSSAGATPLHEAVLAGNKTIVKLLLARGAKQSPNRRGQTPLDLASERGHDGLADLLKQRTPQ